MFDDITGDIECEVIGTGNGIDVGMENGTEFGRVEGNGVGIGNEVLGGMAVTI